MATGSEQPLVIGIDGGATHTNFVLADPQLNVLARSTAGPANINTVGLDSAIRALQQGVIDLLGQSIKELSDVKGIGFALAGADRAAERGVLLHMLETAFPGQAVVLDNDAIAALVGGAGRHYGIVVISGTGSITLGVDSQGQRARADGWGYHLDRGGGYTLAIEALSAIARKEDGVAPYTELTKTILTRLNLRSARDLIPWLYAPGRRVDEIAALAADVVALAEEDAVCTGIILRAADALAAGAVAVARRLHFDAVDSPFPLVMTGSIFNNCALLRDLFTTTVQPLLPAAVIMPPHNDAAVGAAMMALESLHIALPAAQLPTLSKTPRRRPSEQRNRLTMTIGQRTTRDFVRIMNLEDQRVAQKIAPELPEIAALIDALAERFAAGGRIVLAGAGTSGRLAVLDAAECIPTFNTRPDQVIGLMAGGAAALTTSIEGSEDDEAAGRAAIADLNVGTQDCVIGIAASGSTPFVQGVLKAAVQRGALTGSIACAPDAPISALAQHAIEIITGPEIITGSTRLKAGTAQKMVLNMITTGVMVRVGKTFNNLMVDMQPTNQKLRERARIIVAEATGLDLDAAGALLDQCNGEIKTAITAALTGDSPDEARQRLAAVSGNVNRIVTG
ncbi:MAG: N-acetylmuramic acid 6-phosphate etherase [Anaerolineae bacterium]|nr:N-acetylmuramic acid 6-phosphate etherase [Anaerolineae bacterium]